MTIKELIDELTKIENKEMRVFGEFDPIEYIEIGYYNQEEVLYLGDDALNIREDE